MKIVLGAVISIPPVSAGCAWNRLQIFQGLLRLGHDVCFVEEVKPKWSVDKVGRRCAYADSLNRAAFESIMRQHDVLDRSCQLFDGGQATTGMTRERLRSFAEQADLLIDISGHVTTEFILAGVARRAYLDQDPVYTQLWRAEYGKDLRLDRYDSFLTVGLNIGTPRSEIPDCGIRWHPTLPPVILDDWVGTASRSEGGAFTTVASFTGYGDLQFRGEWYRTKYDEFRRFADLPRQSRQPLEVLLKDFSDDDEGIRQLRDGGWIVRRAAETSDLCAYRNYILQSRGEIGITKGAYVKGRSGWFSDRTASYLASGKPCLVQSTGLEHCLPTNRGFVTFHDMAEAVAGMLDINARYDYHCRAARAFATEYLDYRKVLPGMLEACMEPAGAAPAAACAAEVT